MPRSGKLPKRITGHIARKIFLSAGYGMTDEQISELLGVSVDTIDRAKKDAEFGGTLKRVKELSDQKVVNALYMRAIGYDYEEESATKDGPVMCQKKMHPDVTACIFWLKNRQGEQWRDKTPDGEDPAAARSSITQIFCNIGKKQLDLISRGADPMATLFGDDLKNEWDSGSRIKATTGA